MKIIRAEIRNFGSYKNLNIDFDSQGLALISGPTGSGKSTLCDIIPWILFGKTAKGGTVDEVRSWYSDAPTSGKLLLELNGQQLTVYRSRSPNDLWYGEMKRGRDLADTQKLLNALLGMTFETYLLGSYINEFSVTAQFFNSNAKTRRQITENIVDLSLAKILSESGSDYKKQVAHTLLTESTALEYLKKSTFSSEIAKTSRNLALWETTRAKELAAAETSFKFFETDKSTRVLKLIAQYNSQLAEISNEIDSLSNSLVPDTVFKEKLDALALLKAEVSDEICSECGSLKHSNKKMLLERQEYKLDKEIFANSEAKENIKKLQKLLLKEEENLNKAVEHEKNSINTWQTVIESKVSEVNPYEEVLRQYNLDYTKNQVKIKKLEDSIAELKKDLNDIKMLEQIIEDYRSTTMITTVGSLENRTNDLLSRYFEGELSVTFKVENNDKIEVEIFKDGNLASYTQLSKGQRQLLKLTFSLSVMLQVSNHNGVSFNCLFLDEALDGLDSQFKIKAYSLLQELSLYHSSVYCVEHSEDLKLMFENALQISLTSEGSIIL